MKLSAHIRRLLEEEDPKQEKQIEEMNSYDMKYVNGGFKNSVDVQPGVGENLGKVSISINIYGGAEKDKITISTPQKIKELLQAYQIAVHRQDPSADKIKQQLESYYSVLKDTIGKHFVEVMKKMDLEAKQVLLKSINEVNSNY